MKRILITGSRDWTSEWRIGNAILVFVEDHGDDHPFTVVHGGAVGADFLAGHAARALGLRTEVHPADWARYSKRAGYVRNKAMVSLGADVCLAFIKNGSRGATMCAGLAEEAGIPVVYYREDTK